MARCVALTFDDGPSPVTPRLLDTLAAAHVRATFFVVGRQVRARPEVVRRALAEGHVLGNHTGSHARLTALDADQIRQEITAGAEAVHRATGVRPTLLRPPFGAFSATVRQAGHPLVLWDTDTLDWQSKDAAETVRRALDRVGPGSVVLMHDTEPSTADALPELIGRLRGAGYTLVTVPQLFGLSAASVPSVPLSPSTHFTNGADYRRRPATGVPTPHPNTVTWRHRPDGCSARFPDGCPDAEVLVPSPVPGVCYPTDRPGFALRNETVGEVELYRDTGCTVRAATLHPGDEQYGDLRGFLLRPAPAG
ncbi:polysaccharide deacetylase family protein [Streptomyces sp. NPDC051567]|uniref:polysaccharide deacetylase family protein n=1 Tax=Streptomyces sp. NPDC051567 TaxID=3365660 RepID=UPI00378FFE8B